MNRLALSFLFLVVLPAGILAFFAFGAADQDFIEGSAARRSGLEAAAEALARGVESTVAGAVRAADETVSEVARALGASEPFVTDAVVGFARDGAWLGYAIAPAGADAASTPEPFGEEEPSRDNASGRELEAYRMSQRGGEHYELASGDPELAMDAYAFYLPRLRSRVLRDRLRFEIGRAALAAGRIRLAERLFESLVRAADDSLTEEGLPVGALAAFGLLDCADRAGEEVGAEERRTVRDYLRRRHPQLSTPLLARVAERLAADDPLIERVLRRRQALEAALARRPEVLGARDAFLESDALLLARELPRQVAPGVRALLHLPLSLPPLGASGDLEARLELPAGGRSLEPRTGAAAGGDEPEGEPAAARRPVRLGRSGPVLAHIEVRDPRMSEVLEALRRRRDLKRAMVALLVIVTLAGGGALALYLARERRLARLRAQLLANVSHELKTPVTSIRMFSEMLATDDLEETRSRRFARLLHAESLRLSRVIENVLEFSRIERGKRPLSRERFDPRELLARVSESFAYRAREARITLTLEDPADAGDGPFEVDSNAAAVECIVFNLLDNAVKYGAARDHGPAQPPSARGRAAEIRLGLRLDRRTGRCEISVADCGSGIAPEDQERVFEEFYRARFEDYGVQGTGLGLAISRALARSLGGDIKLHSTPGKGSTFTLELPAGALPTDLPADDAAAARRTGSSVAAPESSESPADAAPGASAAGSRAAAEERDG